MTEEQLKKGNKIKIDLDKLRGCIERLHSNNTTPIVPSMLYAPAVLKTLKKELKRLEKEFKNI